MPFHVVLILLELTIRPGQAGRSSNKSFQVTPSMHQYETCVLIAMLPFFFPLS